MNPLFDMSTAALQELRRTFAFNSYLLNKSVEVGTLPTLRYLFAMEQDVARALLATTQGKSSTRTCLRDLYHRARAGARYDRLVRRLGGQLFGSATFAGESVLAENDCLRLSYLPCAPGTARAGVSLFHVGGFLPYGDRIFRILPEANLFRAFLKRGIPVYAMELRGDRRDLGQLRELTLERFIDMVDRMSAVAFEHPANEGRRMIAEGYCGLGLPTLAYIAARPEQADTRFQLATTMVAPIDARECTLLSELLRSAPSSVSGFQAALASLNGGAIPGDALRQGLDIPLGATVYKSPLGRFASGWGNPVYAYLEHAEELDPLQRRELAGAYWISPENCRRFPLPLDLVRFFSELFRAGIDGDLRIPAAYRGEQISLRSVLERTDIDIVGFYGGKDPVVPHTTARVLQQTMGRRYIHVVHPRAGHISYVLSPEIWDPRHSAALDPNPVDLLLETYRSRRATTPAGQGN